MTYVTATELLERFDAAEIAQRVDRGVPRLVTSQLLQDVASSADLSGYTPEEAARAGVAMIVVQRALVDADETINSYLNGHYKLPLALVPAVLKRVACELARFYLYDDQVTDLIRDRYTANIKWLGEVSKGTVSMGADAASGEQPASNASPELVSGATVWDRQTSQGFI